MFSKSVRRIILTTAILAPSVLLTAPGVASLPGGAAACNTNMSWRFADGRTFKTYKSSTALRPGPYADRTPYISLPANTSFQYHCWYENSIGNTWTHGTATYSGRQYDGWIWDNNLPQKGSDREC